MADSPIFTLRTKRLAMQATVDRRIALLLNTSRDALAHYQQGRRFSRPGVLRNAEDRKRPSRFMATLASEICEIFEQILVQEADTAFFLGARGEPFMEMCDTARVVWARYPEDHPLGVIGRALNSVRFLSIEIDSDTPVPYEGSPEAEATARRIRDFVGKEVKGLFIVDDFARSTQPHMFPALDKAAKLSRLAYPDARIGSIAARQQPAPWAIMEPFNPGHRKREPGISLLDATSLDPEKYPSPEDIENAATPEELARLRAVQQYVTDFQSACRVAGTLIAQSAEVDLARLAEKRKEDKAYYQQAFWSSAWEQKYGQQLGSAQTTAQTAQGHETKQRRPRLSGIRRTTTDTSIPDNRETSPSQQAPSVLGRPASSRESSPVSDFETDSQQPPIHVDARDREDQNAEPLDAPDADRGI